jgi:hypothetical protein
VKSVTLIRMLLVGVLLLPTIGFAQISCSRDGLQHAVDLYVAAQTKSDTSVSVTPIIGMTRAVTAAGQRSSSR